MALLTVPEVIEIKHLLVTPNLIGRDGLMKGIAVRYGVSRKAINAIHKGKTWRDVLPELNLVAITKEHLKRKKEQYLKEVYGDRYIKTRDGDPRDRKSKERNIII